ncbi:UNVERIFIED_CONTAM: Chitin-inducible gibberellin-responsive protein 2 [Sesamum calycinum]|uniref:Chitin-inducible gibberellin-responsive protein 2 n=1 Tax=Sesamum calycinum TaxID=2727403 RepID=A0AAW2Q2N9_9LAMI
MVRQERLELMRAYQHHSRSGMPNTLCCWPVGKLENCSVQPCQPSNPHQMSYNNGSNGSNYPVHISQDPYCTLESSSLGVNYTARDSPSTVSFSANESSLSQQESMSHCMDLHHSPDTNYGSPITGPCVTEDVNEFKHKLKELETVMLGPDLDSHEYFDTLPSSIALAEIESWREMMVVVPKGDLKRVLIACAMAVSNGDLLTAQWLISELRQIVSVFGEPVQRLGAYMLEGLVARLNASGSSIYKSLKFQACEFRTSILYAYTL